MNWRDVFSRGRRDRDLEEELQSHLAMAARDRIERGEHPELAERAVRREFGNRALIQETTRDMWGWTWLERLVQDLRYAARGMRRSPGFTAVAVASLALGIGANTAIFSLIDALMLRWLPVHDPQSLYKVKFGGPIESLSYPVVRLLDEQKEIFSGVAGFNGWTFAVGPAGAIRNVRGALVTGSYYETLGLNATVGRLLAPEDDQPGAPAVAVITDGYWNRQFSRDPAVVGQAIRINGVSVPIVGVTPPGFTGTDVGTIADITMTVATLPLVKPEAVGLLGPGNSWLRALARAKERVSIPQASARLAAVWPAISQRAISPAWPLDRKKGITEATIEIKPGGTGSTYLRDLFGKPLLVLMGVVALVLLIACANVANLLLARSAARQKEFAVRLAIGAGRGRLIRQVLTESALLSVAGASLGVALAWLSSRFLVNTISNDRAPIVFDLTPNAHVLAFTAAVAVATAFLFGLAPAWQSTALKPNRHRRSLLLPPLVSVQVALSLLLLIGAGLFVRTLRNLENVDPGFRSEGVLLIELDGRRSADPRDLLETVRRVPGVTVASISTHTPLSGSAWSDPIAPMGQPLPKRDNALFVGAGPAFFDTMRIPLLAGRGFSEHDAQGIPNVAVVNEAFARRYFPDRNPVGQHLSGRLNGNLADLEIVGVARNTSQRGLRAAPPPVVYVSYFQLKGEIQSTLEIRAAGTLSRIASQLQRAVQAKLPEASIEVRTLSAQVERTIAQERMMATLAGGFGTLALLLACVGLYGLLNYGVVRRTREIGIRMALGAQRKGVIAAEVKRAFALVTVGIALGLPAAALAARWIKSMLFGLAPTDPTTLFGAALILVAAALAAAYVPARRASRVNPVNALRHE
jgi:putative ABC transport system permease protein